ncbi:copia protein [Tanacetum coccineum]
MPTHTIPMLSKKPKAATADLHKALLGTRNPGLGYMAKRAQPALYDADTLLHPTHHPVSIWDSEEVLVHQVVSMKKMNEKPGHVRPANGFYEKLNALMFVPQQELSREQAYWLPANERASQTSNPNSPVTPFTHKSRPPSQVLASLQKVNAVFHQFEGIIKERTTQKPDYVSEWCYDYAKQFVEQQLVPFYDHFKKHIQAANDIFFKEVREYEQIFDELEAEYEQCISATIVLTSDFVVPPSSNCLCEDLRSACDREHTKVLELEAEISKQKQLITESEKRFAFLEQNYVSLQLKFQNYKQCIDTSSASNAIFEINKLRQQLQGKDDTIRNLDAQINIMKIQLKDTITSLRIQLDGLKVENVSLKRRYDELSKANTHSRTAYTEKLSAFTAENTKLKAQVTGTTSRSKTLFLVPAKTVSGLECPSESCLAVKSATCRRVPKGSLVVQIVLWYLDSGCSRHMTGDRERLINFVEKFIDSAQPILGRNSFVMGGLEVALRQHSCHIATSIWWIYSKVARSKGRTVADSIAARLTRPTAYKFKTDCSIIPVWSPRVPEFGINFIQDVPIQSSPLGDCGVWVCAHMESLTSGRRLECLDGGTDKFARSYRRRMLQELNATSFVQHDSFCSILLLVPSMQAITLIGKQGSTIKAIQETTSCVVRVLFTALGRHLEEIHVTWDQFWKKPNKMENGHKRRLEESVTDGGDNLQDKIKDLENVDCKMGRSTDTLRLLTNEQKAFRDNLRKSGVGYNGSCVLSQAYAKIPKLYRAYELCDNNEQLHVFDSEETLEDAENSQLKMNKF